MAREHNSSPLLTLVAMISVVAALYLAKAILLPLSLAVLLAFLMTPLANRFERWGLPRVPAVIVVVAVSFAVLGGLGYVVTQQVISLSREMVVYRDDVVTKMRQVTQSIQGIGKELIDEVEIAEKKSDFSTPAEAIVEYDESEHSYPMPGRLAEVATPAQAERSASRDLIESKSDRPPPSDGTVDVRVVEMPPSPLTQIQEWLGPLVTPLMTAGIIFVLVFFILLDRENQRDRLIQLFGTANLHATTEAMHDATRRVGRYLRMMFLMNAGYGLAATIGLALIGVPSALTWGVLGFALRFLPYLGPWITAGMPILVSIAVADGWTQPMMVAGMYVVYELFLNNVAEPYLYGSSIGVSTVGVIVSAIFWTWLWGPIGLVLAMPMTVCLVVMARYVPALRFIGVLLANQPPLTPAERLYQRLLALDYNEPRKLAATYVKSSSVASFYDEVFIPALTMFERDRHADALSEDQEAFLEEATEELVGELALAASHSTNKPENELVQSAKVLCIPLRDQADEISAQMLAQLLSAEGFDAEAGASESLTSETVDQIATVGAEIVVISVLPPIRQRDSRLLWKRLRARYPELPIIVGFWTGSGGYSAVPRPEKDEASKMANTLTDAIALVRAAAAQLRLAKAV